MNPSSIPSPAAPASADQAARWAPDELRTVPGAPWLPGVEAVCYGGDYNPEQWPEEVWAEDVALM
ncbi:MAG: hypothetical protein JJE50_08330, partial [Actinomycetales bacterium]|nr:hypothetical protein [Actinomycetales bacterium]